MDLYFFLYVISSNKIGNKVSFYCFYCIFEDLKGVWGFIFIDYDILIVYNYLKYVLE